jgi:hypothetical protein
VPPFDVFFDAGHAFRSLELVSVTPKLGQYFGTDKGLLVVRAPASQQYGLEEGDVLLSIEGRTPENPGHAFRILRSYQPGEPVKLQVLRNRKRIDVAARVPAEDAVGAAPRPFTVPLPPRTPPPPVPPSPSRMTPHNRSSSQAAATSECSASMRGPCCAASSITSYRTN